LTPTPTRTVLQFHTSPHKALSPIVIQMRNEKIGLREFLFQRHVLDVMDANFKDLGTETWERMDPREILNESEQAEGRHAS
jgi:hypothetical protein